MAELIAGWTAPIAAGEGDGSEALRLAAIQLALAAAHVEPNMRARHAYEWAMDKRWVGLDPAGRARIAAALLAACGKIAPPPELETPGELGIAARGDRLGPRDPARAAPGRRLAAPRCWPAR